MASQCKREPVATDKAKVGYVCHIPQLAYTNDRMHVDPYPSFIYARPLSPNTSTPPCTLPIALRLSALDINAFIMSQSPPLTFASHLLTRTPEPGLGHITSPSSIDNTTWQCSQKILVASAATMQTVRHAAREPRTCCGSGSTLG